MSCRGKGGTARDQLQADCPPKAGGREEGKGLAEAGGNGMAGASAGERGVGAQGHVDGKGSPTVQRGGGGGGGGKRTAQDGLESDGKGKRVGDGTSKGAEAQAVSGADSAGSPPRWLL